MIITMAINMDNHHTNRWDVSLLSVLLNMLLPLLVGYIIARSTDTQARALLLAYTTLFTTVTSLFAIASVRRLVENQPNAEGFLLTELIAILVVPALMVIGAGLSRKRTKKRALKGTA